MNYRGSYKKLLGNSRAALVAAIEIYNKPMFEYRNECTVILLLNAWELLTKAILSKNKTSIYYPKERNQPYKTLSLSDAISKAQPHFPSSIPYIAVKSNLELLRMYRDNAVHFYNAEDFGIVLYSLSQTSIVNYRDVSKNSFDIDLADNINWRLLPLGIRPPIDALSYISGESSVPRSTAVRQFLSELVNAVNELKEVSQDTGRLLTIYDVKLESVKTIGDADVVIGISEETNGPLAILRTQDPNKSHPLRQKEVLERIPSLHGYRFTSHKFQAVIWWYSLRERPQYCWRADEGILTKYSHDIVPFISQLTKGEVDSALDNYRKFLKTKSAGK